MAKKNKMVTLWLLTVNGNWAKKARSANQLNINIYEYIKKNWKTQETVGKPKLHVANGKFGIYVTKRSDKIEKRGRITATKFILSIYLELLTALLLPTGIFCTDPLFATLVALLELFTLFDRFDCCCGWYEFTDA